MKYLMYISQNYAYAILRPLQDRILASGGQVGWFLEGGEVSEKHLKESEKRLLTVNEVVNWRPDAVFVPGNVVPDFIPGIKVGVFHGFNVGKINRRGRSDHFEIRHCFDLYCTQGPDTTEPFKALQKADQTFDVVQTGWSALDPLFTTAENNPYINKQDKRKTVLMCSTFSRNLSCAPIVFEKIKELSETGKWRWLIQFHPKMDKEIVEKYRSLSSEHLQFVETDNVLPLLQAADVMFCDTSSVLIMYLLQRRPVVTFNNNTGNECLLNIDKLEKIEKTLEYALTYPQDLMQKIDAYCEEIHPYHDGSASERVIKATNNLIGHGISHLKRKPLNLIRKLKLRKKLNYWKR